MGDRSEHPTGILMVRLWLEGDRPEALRARITHSTDAASRQKEVEFAASADDLSEVIRTWVARFIAEAAPARRSGHVET